MKYKKGSAWKRGHWDKWTLGRKIWHVIAVIFAYIIFIGMWVGFAIVVLYLFAFKGYLMTMRDGVLLELAHWLFD